ncbi:MAG: hypothetical protein Q7S50_02560 [bacterium]|nr:hypothetical protein [bacterium]
MLMSVSGLLGGFVLWLLVRQILVNKVGSHAAAVFFVCMAAGLVLGLWGDSDTILAISRSIHRGSAPAY